MPACYAHPEQTALHTCTSCGRGLCELCRFVVGAEPRCPDCMLAGRQRPPESKNPQYSLALGAVAVVFLMAFFVVAALGDSAGYGVLFLGALICMVAGLTLGLTARRDANNKMPVLAIVGASLNGLLLLLFAVLICVGMSKGG